MAVLDLIDHISAYCDSWCERCAFTSRCSAYAVRIATAMCDGDAAAGFELALGPPVNPEGAKHEEVLGDSIVEGPTEAEIAQTARESKARRERMDEVPVSKLAWKVTWLSRNWLDTHAEHWWASAPILGEAIQLARWDCFFITVKIRRALSGRDEYLQDNVFDDHSVQNDWNGSAKVALISIVRTTEAWSVIAGISGDPDAAHVEVELRRLRDEVERMFPDAWRFVRPGFDTHRDANA
jgi:hypothetical protein